MSLKKVLYLLLVVVVAGVSGLSGAAVGGAVVYRTLQEQATARSSRRLPAASTSPAQNSDI